MTDASNPHRWSLARGAQRLSDNSVRFSVSAPHAKRTHVRIGDGSARGDHALASVDDRGLRETIPASGGGDVVPLAVQIEGEPGDPKRLLPVRCHAVRLPSWSAALYVSVANGNHSRATSN